MKERPILFNSEMVQAILSGRKTMTRRAVPDWQLPQSIERKEPRYNEVEWRSIAQRHPRYGFAVYGATEESCMNQYNLGFKSLCPKGNVGDQLWVREKFCFDNKEYIQTYESEPWRGMPDRFAAQAHYRASESNPELFPKWTPSIHMPRWASRIQLEITNVRVERLQDISEEDAKAEGLRFHSLYNEWGGVEKHPASSESLPQWRWYESPVKAFEYLWDSINGKDDSKNWKANPWVWVIEFKVVSK